MNCQLVPLCRLPVGGFGVVRKLGAIGTSRRRMLDLGLINGTVVETVLSSPAGDPMAYMIRGAVIALRSEEAGKILVDAVIS